MGNTERKEKEINHAIRNKNIGNPIVNEFAKYFFWFLVKLTKGFYILPWLIRDELFFILLYPMEYVELQNSNDAGLYVVKNLFAQIVFVSFYSLCWSHWQRNFWMIIFPWEAISAFPLSLITHTIHGQNFTKAARVITIFCNIYVWGLISADY